MERTLFLGEGVLFYSDPVVFPAIRRQESAGFAPVQRYNFSKEAPREERKLEYYDDAVDFWKRLSEDPAEMRRQLSGFVFRAAYHSAKLENPEISFCALRELLTYGKMGNYEISEETRAQISGLAAASQRAFDAMVNRELPSRELALALNTMLIAGSGSPSGIKPGLARPMQEILEEVNAYNGMSVLKASAYLHGALLYLNPFDRFNGRTVRMLTNCYLVAKGHPPLVIFCYDRKFYCESVVAYFEKEELEPLWNFLQYETARTWSDATRGAAASHG